jgi:flavin-dependent dehydrogenase
LRIAIVGAGPAGCHLAHRLGGTDHDILLFDPQVPYEKPCGGGLSPLAGRLFADVMDLPFDRHTPSRLLLRASDDSQVEQALYPASWMIVSRADLGRVLLERALASNNIRLIRRRVTDMEPVADKWQVRTAQGLPYIVDFLVGADGVRSIVRKHVVGPIPRQHLSLAVGYRVQGAPDAMVFETFSDLEGYLWSFPRSDHASVGIGARLGSLPTRELWRRVDRFLHAVRPEASKAARWAALLPTARDATLWDTPCAGPGWALLGDAAGHVHPLTGEGIAYALWSAKLLAKAFLMGNPGLYEDLWRERYGGTLAAAAEMVRGVHGQKGAFEMVFHLTMAMALPTKTGLT